jgi:hypothetical protein
MVGGLGMSLSDNCIATKTSEMVFVVGEPKQSSVEYDPFAEMEFEPGPPPPTDENYDEEAEELWFEQQHDVVASIERQQKINDIKARMAACGSYIQVPVGKTGGVRWIKIICDYWRDNYNIGHVCPKCFARRVAEFKGNAKRALVNNNYEDINYLVVDIEIAKQITKGVNRKHYHNIDWKEYANTPERMRPSGGLGTMPKIPKPEEEGEKATVYTQSIHTENISNEDMREALVAAYEETKELDPHTEDELQDALNKRTSCYIKHLRAKGAKITTFTTTISEYLVCIDWQGHIQTNLEDAKKLKRPIL